MMTEPITDKLDELLVARMKPFADEILASWPEQPKTNLQPGQELELDSGRTFAVSSILVPVGELGVHHQETGLAIQKGREVTIKTIDEWWTGLTEDEQVNEIALQGEGGTREDAYQDYLNEHNECCMCQEIKHYKEMTRVPAPAVVYVCSEECLFAYNHPPVWHDGFREWV